MALIETVLAIAALYCAVAYVLVARTVANGSHPPVQGELETFHLGLCFLVSLGFLGLMLK